MRPSLFLACGWLLVACGDGADAVSAPRLPCAVERVLVARCLGCHDNPPALGVPISFDTFEATRVETTLTRSGASEPIWQAMREVLEDGRMPLDPDTGLAAPLPEDDPDRVLLLAWFAGGAEPAPEGETCSNDAGP